MNKILQITFVAVGILVLAGGVFFAGTFLGSRLNGPASGSASGFAVSQGNQVQPQTRSQVPSRPSQGRGGMMNGGAPGGRGDGNQSGGGVQGFGPGGMMNGNNANQASLTPVTADEAKTAAQVYLTTLNISGLEVGDVTIIDSSAYVVVKETAGGNGAFELIVDPRSRSAHPDGGASMMWNLKYGGVLQAAMPLGGRGFMMGRNGAAGTTATPTPAATSVAPLATPANVSADMPVTATQAVAAAQAFLDNSIPGTTAAATPVQFYGYYSVSYSKAGTVVGILSVNGFNSEVLPAMPHGMFGLRPQ